jgi:hypothetical protein
VITEPCSQLIWTAMIHIIDSGPSILAMIANRFRYAPGD